MTRRFWRVLAVIVYLLAAGLIMTGCGHAGYLAPSPAAYFAAAA